MSAGICVLKFIRVVCLIVSIRIDVCARACVRACPLHMSSVKQEPCIDSSVFPFLCCAAPLKKMALDQVFYYSSV